MRYLPSDKYNVAWFKLAECVSRGEKERALGVYRLLSHSIDDIAFVHQLEGDILLAFGDTVTAVVKYQHAMDAYKRDGRIFESTAIGEHLYLLSDDKSSCAARLSKLYQELGMHAKALEYAYKVAELYIQAGYLDAAAQALDEIDQLAGADVAWQARKALVFAMINKGRVPLEVIVEHAKKVLNVLLSNDDARLLQQFLLELEVADPQVYASLCNAIESNK